MSPTEKRPADDDLCVCEHVFAHHLGVMVYDGRHCRWKGCGCPKFVKARGWAVSQPTPHNTAGVS